LVNNAIDDTSSIISLVWIGLLSSARECGR